MTKFCHQNFVKKLLGILKISPDIYHSYTPFSLSTTRGVVKRSRSDEDSKINKYEDPY